MSSYFLHAVPSHENQKANVFYDGNVVTLSAVFGKLYIVRANVKNIQVEIGGLQYAANNAVSDGTIIVLTETNNGISFLRVPLSQGILVCNTLKGFGAIDIDSKRIENGTSTTVPYKSPVDIGIPSIDAIFTVELKSPHAGNWWTPPVHQVVLLALKIEENKRHLFVCDRLDNEIPTLQTLVLEGKAFENGS